MNNRILLFSILLLFSLCVECTIGGKPNKEKKSGGIYRPIIIIAPPVYALIFSRLFNSSRP
jgi:hypothetical protein